MDDAKVTPEVRAVLERSTIEGNILKLPDEQLARPLYEAVNKVLGNAGGVWNRGKKGHVFPGDPRPKLGLALETGVAIDEKKKFQAFFTPEDIANLVVGMGKVNGCNVLEPSAGSGALMKACFAHGAQSVHAIEINPEHHAELSLYGATVIIQDFITIKPDPQFDRVVMNPPFTKKQDLKHVAHALKFLKPGGRLVAIVQANRLQSDVEKMTGHDYDVSTQSVDAGAFKESGTPIATQIVLITPS